MSDHKEQIINVLNNLIKQNGDILKTLIYLRNSYYESFMENEKRLQKLEKKPE